MDLIWQLAKNFFTLYFHEECVSENHDIILTAKSGTDTRQYVRSAKIISDYGVFPSHDIREGDGFPFNPILCFIFWYFLVFEKLEKRFRSRTVRMQKLGILGGRVNV